MTDQLHQQWEGTDEEARKEAYSGAGYWLATPIPRSELAFSGLVAVGAVAVTVSLWGRGAGEAIGLGLLTLAFAVFCAAPAVWTQRHPELAGRHMAAARSFSRSRWRKHPAGVTVGVVVIAFTNGFLRINDRGTSGRLVAGAASSGFALILCAVLVWHSRRHTSQAER